MTPYSEVFKRFNMASRFYDLDAMTETESDEFLKLLMSDAIVEVRSSKVNLEDRDDTLDTFNITLSPIIQKIIAEYMIYGWTKRYLYDQDLLEQYMSSNAIKSFSPAAHIAQLREVKANAKLSAQRLEKQYSISNAIGSLG